ncbi:MAG: hypothetical protein H0W02_21495 [Ktedonobacteraceae bacterium]|nr:hypothetical protein [Ktedonobacteraceae bacterium]
MGSLVATFEYALIVNAYCIKTNLAARVRLGYVSLGFSPLILTLTGLLLQYSGPRVTILLAVGGQVLLALLATLNPDIRQA